MGKVSGKTAKFVFDSVERSFDSATFDVAYQEIDTTDSSTVSPATDTVLNRQEATMKIDATLEAALGTEVVTGTLTANQKYLVTGGTLGGAAVGYMFTAAGTETATATNKVKPVGAKLMGKGASITIGGSAWPLTSFKFDEQYGSFDVTDSTTSAEYVDKIAGRATRTTSLECIMLSDAADNLTASPAAAATVVTIASGITITGNAIFKKKTWNISAKGDAVEVSYELNWVGPVTLVVTNMLTPAVSTAFELIGVTGTSTNKEVTGNAIVMSRSIDFDVNSAVKVSYSLDCVGALTYAVAN